jgi:hypothetical protein
MRSWRKKGPDVREKDTANLVKLATQGVGRAGLFVVLLIAVIGLLAGCPSRPVETGVQQGVEHAARQVDNVPSPRVPSEFRWEFRRYPSGVAHVADNPGAFGLSEQALRARAVLDRYFYEGDVYDRAVALGACTGFEQLMDYQQEYQQQLEDGTLVIDASVFKEFLVDYVTSLLIDAGFEVIHADVVETAYSFVETYVEYGDTIPPHVLKAYFQACVLR